MTSSLEHLDVAIIGAGLSGIGAAYYLQQAHPGKSYAVLEARADLGGTWDLFRYPGIRSDSDLHTYGYEFKPWVDDQSIASGHLILDYLREAAAENGIDRRIRVHHQVRSAAWSSESGHWTIEVARGDTGTVETMTAGWLFCAGGYYRYDDGFTPTFEGLDDYAGQVVHPQKWPEDLDWAGKRVVVIGSGATAVTLIPSLARTAEHVTMLQRSPTYILPVPGQDKIANGLRKILPAKGAYAATRRKNILKQRLLWTLSMRYPTRVRALIRGVNVHLLPKGYDVDTHFKPTYNPWEQRMCAVPDGDLFEAIGEGRASIVTDHIDHFGPDGIVLASGTTLEADIVVTATGFTMQPFGGIALSVDGEQVDLTDTVAYKGMMLSGVPNFAFAIGYTNSSWTLKIGLLCQHFTKLIAHMDQTGTDMCVPELRDPHMKTRPLLDFGAGYVRRAVDNFPRQGTEYPWLMSMSYESDVKVLRKGDVIDDHLRFAPVAGR